MSCPGYIPQLPGVPTHLNITILLIIIITITNVKWYIACSFARDATLAFLRVPGLDKEHGPDVSSSSRSGRGAAVMRCDPM